MKITPKPVLLFAYQILVQLPPTSNHLHWNIILYLEIRPSQVVLVVKMVAQMVKNPPAMRETWVRFLGWEDPLEEGMAIHSSILAWRIPKDRGAWQAAVHGVAKSQT